MKRRLVAASAAVLMLALSGCAASEELAGQYEDGSGQGYISGDGAYLELPADQREPAIEFEGESETGATISSDNYDGEVLVVNFWYASCPPCRAEASDLKALSEQYTDVPFLGVNIIDDSANAVSFAKEFGIEYPSIMDARTTTVQLAFAGSVAPNAVPTTLVIDREGRVAARISGVIQDQSILASMIDSVVAEDD